MTEKIKASVLLVDDEEQFLETLSQRLENRGLKVNAVTSGEEALSKVEDKNFDAIILDFAMPGIDGIETLRRIKEKHPDLEIIMLTGQATVQVGVEAMKSGVDDFLEKPIEISELMKKIGKAKHKKMLLMEKSRQEEVKKILRSKGW